jgi:hypothetical protein
MLNCQVWVIFWKIIDNNSPPAPLFLKRGVPFKNEL